LGKILNRKEQSSESKERGVGGFKNLKVRDLSGERGGRGKLFGERKSSRRRQRGVTAIL